MERTGAGVGPQPASVEGSLETTLRRFTEAFNRFDAKAFASFWAEDGTFLNPLGRHARGRAGIEKVFQEDEARLLEGATVKLTITGARPIGDDCVLLDCDNDVQNVRLPDRSRGPMKMHAVIVAQKNGDRWQWLDVRAYGFLQRPPPVH